MNIKRMELTLMDRIGGLHPTFIARMLQSLGFQALHVPDSYLDSNPKDTLLVMEGSATPNHFILSYMDFPYEERRKLPSHEITKQIGERKQAILAGCHRVGLTPSLLTLPGPTEPVPHNILPLHHGVLLHLRARVEAAVANGSMGEDTLAELSSLIDEMIEDERIHSAFLKNSPEDSH